MSSVTAVTVLDRATLRETRAKVFQRGESTLTEEARGMTLAGFEATITGIRRDMRALLAALPEDAYAAQPDDDGAMVWSAGQVTLHVCDSATNIFGHFLRRAAGLPDGFHAPRVVDKAAYPLASRAEALALLDACDRDLAGAFGAAPAGLDLTAEATVEPMGTTTIAADLMIFAIHEDDHLGQLQELAARFA